MLLMSACLAGRPCRYDGSACPHPWAVARFERGEAVLVCPEELGGLPTPRQPSERRGGRVVSIEGADVTEQFVRGAREALRICEERGCDAAVLKARSPSCGCGRIYDGSFTGALVVGNGVLAELLLERGIPVRTEEELQA